MNNSTQATFARNPHTRPWRGIGCWRRWLAASLTLMLAAVLQSARAQSGHPALVGEWLNGSANLADVSGYSPAGTHDGYAVGGGNYVFTNDVPPGKTGQSLFFYNGDTAIAISNSSTLDANYTNTFDDQINNAFTISCWARGFPAGWYPFVSKWGEGRPYNSPDGGWQLRTDGANDVYPMFTVRDEQIGVFGANCDTNDATDDMGTTLIAGNDGAWHFYAGTFNANTGVRSLYVDSVLAAQETGNVEYDLAPYAHVCIGAKDNPPGSTYTSFSTNNIEYYDVRIYNYDLTQAQVTALYGVVPVAINSQPQSTAQFTNLPAKFVAVFGLPFWMYKPDATATFVILSVECM